MSVGVRLLAADFWPVPMHQSDTARDTICYAVEVNAVAAGDSAPFWLYALSQGNISGAPYSGNLSAAVYKHATRPNRWFDYDFGVALAGRCDTEGARLYARRLYAHARLYVVDMTAGIAPIVCGSQEPLLTTGGLLFSQNAYPIPRISIGVDQYTAVPGLYGYLELKAGLTHGWMVDNCALDTMIHTTNTLLHYKFLGLRVGGEWPVNVSYEFHHAAQWGGRSPYYGTFPISWESYKQIFLAQGGGVSQSDMLNAAGNHIGFQELAITAKLSDWHVTAYWQTIFEDKSADLIGRSNQTDGLWGITIRQKQWPWIRVLAYEFLNTTQQNGPWHDRDGLVYGGRSNYYNNSSYKQGWTHFARTIGNAMMSPENNRVRTHFAGIMGDIYGYRYRVMAAYTRNWGTYEHPQYSQNTAVMLEVHRRMQKVWDMDFGVRLAADLGSQYGNRFGAMITISKQGIIHSY